VPKAEVVKASKYIRGCAVIAFGPIGNPNALYRKKKRGMSSALCCPPLAEVPKAEVVKSSNIYIVAGGHQQWKRLETTP
jgi:hypothetical protein